jgi:hypothetical protein
MYMMEVGSMARSSRLKGLTQVLLFAALLLAMVAVGGCGGSGSDGTNIMPPAEESVAKINITGPDCNIDGNIVNITGGGEYTLSGSTENGGVVVDALGENVHVVLSGVTITNLEGPAILVRAASAARITISDGSVNALTDGGADEEHDAAIFSSVPLVIDGDGVLDVTGNYQEGIASDSTVTINGGNIRVTAADDGLNSGEGIVINGGYIFVDSVGDGIDSNAALTINGGTVLSLGGTVGGDGGLDAEEGFKLSINGGLVIATGLSNTRPDVSSVQNYILLSFGENRPVGTLVRIEDENGAEIVTFKPDKEYAEFLFSSYALVSGMICKVYSGGESSGSEYNDGLLSGGTYSGGTRLSHFNDGDSSEDFVISSAGGVFNLSQGFPGETRPPNNGGTPPGQEFPGRPPL